MCDCSEGKWIKVGSKNIPFSFSGMTWIIRRNLTRLENNTSGRGVRRRNFHLALDSSIKSCVRVQTLKARKNDKYLHNIYGVHGTRSIDDLRHRRLASCNPCPVASSFVIKVEWDYFKSAFSSFAEFVQYAKWIYYFSSARSFQFICRHFTQDLRHAINSKQWRTLIYAWWSFFSKLWLEQNQCARTHFSSICGNCVWNSAQM